VKLPYYNAELVRGHNPEAIPAQTYCEVVELLGDPLLDTLIEAGNITVAMIRPDLEGNLNEDGNDQQLSDLIEMNIGRLGMMAKFSVQFDEAAVEEFYGGRPKEVQLNMVPERYDEYFANRWDEFKHLMMNGQSTVLILHSPTGDAIEGWREQVGHFDIVGRRDPMTIRGHFGTDNYNNLVHGSDSPESAAREIGIIRNLIGRVSQEHA
jgi:nucleoside diphosphate kinase